MKDFDHAQVSARLMYYDLYDFFLQKIAVW